MKKMMHGHGRRLPLRAAGIFLMILLLLCACASPEGETEPGTSFDPHIPNAETYASAGEVEAALKEIGAEDLLSDVLAGKGKVVSAVRYRKDEAVNPEGVFALHTEWECSGLTVSLSVLEGTCPDRNVYDGNRAEDVNIWAEEIVSAKPRETAKHVLYRFRTPQGTDAYALYGFTPGPFGTPAGIAEILKGISLPR